MDLERLIQFFKPLVVVILAIIGYFQEIIFDKDLSNAIFIMVIAIYIIDWVGIINKVKETICYLKK